MFERHEYLRSHGLGNDYLVIEPQTFGVFLTDRNIRRICDRHTGVGSDGILEVVNPPEGFDCAVRIWNPDGSEAEKSGNGVRIFAKYWMDHNGGARDRAIKIHTLGGAMEALFLRHENGQTYLRVSMGSVSFRCADLPMTGAEEWVQKKLKVGDREFTATCLSVGNPHAVMFDAPFDEVALCKYGPLIENHPQFPRRTNVQFAEVVDRQTVKALIWERGAGKTESSGSSACAVASACYKAGLVDGKVEVVMPGGTLEVVVHPDYRLEQIGFAQEISRGKLAADLLADLTSER